VAQTARRSTMWRELAYFGAAHAALGIAQEVFWPD
jgi:hypothetical protein